VTDTNAGGKGELVVIVIDDHGIFARGLELLLGVASSNRIRVAARTEHASEALDLVRRHRPHVAIVDLAMPPPGGLGAIKEIRRHYPAVRILALSGTECRDDAIAALAAGAAAFIPKSSSPEVLVPPLLSLAAGLSVVPDELLRYLVDLTDPASRAVVSELDDEEVKLWRLVAQGLDSNEIAEQLFVSERTAKRMVASLLRRLGANNRIEAAVLAGRAGLLTDGTPPAQ
jgi:DNA-binding NarL/FixJ family response regulator